MLFKTPEAFCRLDWVTTPYLNLQEVFCVFASPSSTVFERLVSIFAHLDGRRYTINPLERKRAGVFGNERKEGNGYYHRRSARRQFRRSAAAAERLSSPHRAVSGAVAPGDAARTGRRTGREGAG